ncbi:MAG: EAL domain-containing protein [Lachnospiraceae bacterium]|nr:EAL domain-containing protein [Lachnospiraceae bacterium]
MYTRLINTGSGIELVLATLICLLSVLLFLRPKQVCEGMNYRLIKNGMILLAINQVLEFVKIMIFTTNAVDIEALIYVFYLVYYLSQALAFFCAVQYVLFLLPSVRKVYVKELRTFYFWVMIAVSVLVLSTPLTGFAYTIEDGVITDGMAVLGARLFRLAVLIALIIHINFSRVNYASKIAYDIMLSILLPILFHLAQFVLPDTNFFGISLFALFSCMFWIHYGGHYKDGEAREKHWVFTYDMRYKCQNEEEFSVMELRIKNLDNLLMEYDLDEIDTLNGRLIRGVVAKNLKTQVYFRDYRTYRFIIETIDNDDIYNVAGAVKEVMSEYLDGKTEYTFFCAKCPEQIHKDTEMVRLFDVAEKNCKRNMLYMCGEEDIEEFEFSSRMERVVSGIRANQDNLIVYASPLVDIKTREIIRFDLTSRIQIPGYGIAKAGRFIDLAKRKGLLTPITLMVVEMACKVLSGIARERDDIRFVIHVSNRELFNAEFVNNVLKILDEHPFADGLLGFELILDDMKHEDYEEAAAVVNTLKQRGITFMLDEFTPDGANFNAVISLGIKKLRLKDEVLKYAKESPEYYDMLGTMIDVLHQFGAEVAFKDVDDEEMEELATSLGADFIQGSLYSKHVLLGYEVLHMADNWDGYI